MSFLPNGTSERLAKILEMLARLPEFLKVPYRQNLQFLADHLNYEGWVAMSKEELILRNHYDFLGYHDGPRQRTVEFFHHENLLLMLGRVPNVPQVYRHVVREVVGNLVKANLLAVTSVGDIQASWCASRLVNEKMPMGEAVYELRKRLNENRA